MKEFEDKVAVVTGAASGIGLGLVHHFLKEGIKKNKFYIYNHPEFNDAIKLRLEDIALQRNPSLIQNLPDKK
jgi:hypothetical protein